MATPTPRRPSPRSQRAQRRGGAPARFSFAVFAIALVVFALILARLVAAAAPSFDGGGSGFTPSGSGQPNNYYSLPSGP